MELDTETAHKFLEEFSEQVNIPPVNGTLLIESGVVSARNGVPGRQIDIDTTMALLNEDPFSVLDYGFLPAAMAPWDPQILDVTEAAERAAGSWNPGGKFEPTTR